jgi:hypothetical protein
VREDLADQVAARAQITPECQQLLPCNEGPVGSDRFQPIEVALRFGIATRFRKGANDGIEMPDVVRYEVTLARRSLALCPHYAT